MDKKLSFRHFLTVGMMCLGTSALALDIKIDAFAQSGIRTVFGTHNGSILIKLPPGWKTYWRNPGDSGLAPVFDISGSKNIQSIEFHWPRPELEVLDGITSLVYQDQLFLPFEVVPVQNTDAKLNLEAQIGICKNICLPWDISISAKLPATGGSLPDGFTEAVAQTIPVLNGPNDFGAKCNIEPSEGYLDLELDFAGRGFGEELYTIIESNDPRHVIFDIQSLPGPLHKLHAKIADIEGKGLVFSRKNIQVTLLDHEKALSFLGCE